MRHKTLGITISVIFCTLAFANDSAQEVSLALDHEIEVVNSLRQINSNSNEPNIAELIRANKKLELKIEQQKLLNQLQVDSEPAANQKSIADYDKSIAHLHVQINALKGEIIALRSDLEQVDTVLPTDTAQHVQETTFEEVVEEEGLGYTKYLGQINLGFDAQIIVTGPKTTEQRFLSVGDSVESFSDLRLSGEITSIEERAVTIDHNHVIPLDSVLSGEKPSI